MRRSADLVLDERDEEVAQLLSALGLAPNTARALSFLRLVREATSAEIETGAGLRQPEVSVAMQQLRAREWVRKRDLHREGKGRPVHAYALTRPFPEIVDELERGVREAASRQLTAIERIRVATVPRVPAPQATVRR
ncbi:MAG TPA: ArsR family transcriptional regulator [Candidatus Thermoplasmatota archaeon]|nr:ArsR family transcriptional regulator [Candidatus Thermoplasmatota archaeon]